MIRSHLNPRPEAADSAAPSTTVSERKRILLVEGDGFTRLVLLLRLRLAGFAVDFTSNGTLGLGKLRSCEPDILLLELKLCGLSGLDLIKAARTESGFGDRPIYVFTHADRMNRATRKEMASLGTKVFDKGTMTREDLVQLFATTFLNRQAVNRHAPESPATETETAALSEVAVSGAIGELVAGVREQAELVVQDNGDKSNNGTELLSRVSSVGSCAKAAGLPDLARHAKAFENFLTQLCRTKQAFADTALDTVKRAVDVMSHMTFETGGKPQAVSRFKAVYLDEAPFSNRAAEEALLSAGFDPVCFEDPGRAREYLASNQTEIIIANVALPEAHGLAVADVRRFPFHTRTALLFGPESRSEPMRGELPTAAARLDKSPLLLSELVLRALNLVQSPSTNEPAVSPVTVQPKSAVRPNSAASLPADDGFALFAVPAQQEPAAVFQASIQTPSIAAAAVHPPQRFEHLFTAAGIPSEPIMRAEPVISGADQEAESVTVLPANGIEGIQLEEQAIEADASAVFQSQLEATPQPEAAAEDQAAPAEYLATAPSDAAQLLPDTEFVSDLQQNQAAAAEQSAESVNDGELMNNQFRAAPAELAQPDGTSQSGEDVNGQRTQRQDLIARVCEAEMALYRAQMQIEESNKTVESLQQQLAEAQAGQGSTTQAPAGAPTQAQQNAQARCAELEQEVAALREALAGLNCNFSETQQTPAETDKRLQELEQRLSQSVAELDKQKEAQARAQEEWRQQLDAAKGASQQTEAERQQLQNRCGQLEQELSSARQAAKEAAAKPVKEQKASVASQENGSVASAAELEQQVREGVAALARATADLAKERGERQRAQQLATELNGRLQALHVDLSRTLQTQGEHLSRITALEQQHHQASQALERATADVEQHQAERRLADAQVQKLKEANAQMRKDLSFFEEANNEFGGARQELQTRLEASLNAARESDARLQQETVERQRLAQSLEEARRELQNQSRRRESLEQELAATREALQERENKLQQEAAERQRLSEAQGSLQHSLPESSERDLEFSKLRTALQLEQVERKRQESQLARTRQHAVDAAHAARNLRASLRRQIREPVDNLVHTTRNLLELEMDEQQKKLAEAVLQDVLLVQTRLRDPGAAHSEITEPSATPSPSAS